MKPVLLSDTTEATLITGVHGSCAPAFAAEHLSRSQAGLAFLFVRNLGEAEAWFELLHFWTATLSADGAKPELLLLPEIPDSMAEQPRAFDLACDRLSVLTRLLELQAEPQSRPVWVVTTVNGFFAPAPDPRHLRANELRVRVGDRLQLRSLADRLGQQLGYTNEVVCESPGQYALRGGLLDVYPVNVNAPVRIDFFGDEVDSIRAFDPTSQLTSEKLEAVTIAALGGSAQKEREGVVIDYLPQRKIHWLLWETDTLVMEARHRFETLEIRGPGKPTFQELIARQSDVWTGLSEFETEPPLFPVGTARWVHYSESLEIYRSISLDDVVGTERLQIEQEARERFLGQLTLWQDEGYRVALCLANESEEQRARGMIEDFNLKVGQGGLKPDFLRGPLDTGFRIKLQTENGRGDLFRAGGSLIPKGSIGLILATGNELFSRFRARPAGMRRRKLVQRQAVDQLLDFSELAEGDYLVHAAQGVCRFRGLHRMELRGRKEEVISLEFADGITLHLPLYEAHLISRYVGLSKVRPKLGKLGSGQWEKTRRAAEQATLDFAADLLRLQAARDTKPGHAFAMDSEWQRRFEESFPHTETPDQLRAINDSKHDMEQPRPMDRLLCGDVGFGKTEVAIRTAFKAVMDNHQVAILVPTTVLAQQHFNTFRERMVGYPVTVEMLSRFRTRQQQDQIIAQTAAGKIDILIGTHSLLGKEVAFKNLGLLVIDEEHRFGVRHKEKIKSLRENIDVLTMSATPIPRTLHMALTGARDLSVIETAPVDRLPIQTFVKSYTPELVKEAITYEVGRGGQVFYLHNRVDTIESVALRLQEMMPDLRIGIGHGQMPEGTLEKIMTRYVAGYYDVLVCTTIIESGLDIPNCNTIIIEGADRFGLAQLYQLRGRVGRFNRQAYCYLLLHKHARMLDHARKRLSAIRQYNQLGAGFKIAMRDLELRGAGNLLGSQQSGHIASVGFDLYCQLLRQSISRLKGEPNAIRIRASVRLDFVSSGETGENASIALGYAALKAADLEDHYGETIEAGLPAAYIGEARLRIDFYRKLAIADNESAVGEIERALTDRFGPPPISTQALLRATEIRTIAESAGILSVETEGNRLKLRRATGQRDDFVLIGTRFPRLSEKDPIKRLKEIKTFLKRLPK